MKKLEHSFIREILKVASDPGVISFAGGLPKGELFPVGELQAAFSRVLTEEGAAALQYNRTEGYEPLRRWICDRLACESGLRATPEQVLITTGSQQALDLLGKLFLSPSASVAMEEPGYLGAKQVFRMQGATIHPVSLSPDGMNPERLERVLEEHAPALVYGMSSFQNPTGGSYTAAGADSVAGLLRDSPALFVEDDPYGELHFTGASSNLKIYSRLEGNAFYLGSFSKVVAPSFRLGYLLGPGEAITQLVRAKQASDLHSSHLLQMVLYRFVSSPAFEEHLERIRATYASQRDAMVAALRRHLPPEIGIRSPEGGMFLWVELPEEISADSLFERAIRRGVAFVPGRHFYEAGGTNALRLNFSNVSVEQIEEGIGRLADAFAELLTVTA